MDRKTIQINSLNNNSKNTAIELTKYFVNQRESKESGVTFIDPAIEFSFDQETVYLLNFSLLPQLFPKLEKEENSDNAFDIKIVLGHLSKDNNNDNVNDTSYDEQEIKTFEITLNDEENVSKINNFCVFKPLVGDYNFLAFRIVRRAKDYSTKLNLDEIKNDDRYAAWFSSNKKTEYDGRFLKLEPKDISLYTLDNVLKTLKDTEQKFIIQRLGIQGRPGMLFAIDGEEMKLNKNGIYEVSYDNLNIQHIGFLNQEDDFILDITYTKTVVNNETPESGESSDNEPKIKEEVQ